ncbi:N-acetylneuraminate synthase [Ectothiorhodospira marina]|uniref:N,N'-diacetyllegionaminate synthase n=1 Tax=Ectothiorhodospira marina TaxID=1396821 RepID=A0A1H7IAI7_9GAMM|nr:N-acetylneuraminate synthase [Ectothiorhodospira marina]SEK59448.1 N,N'-diacetyllegionaminate synthase [Ectothiorhodospira marina]
MTEHTTIIAEAGVNHNGDLELAKQLIDAAAEAGADLVKFQTFSAERLVTQSAPKADYQTRTTEKSESQFTMLRQLELDDEMHGALMAHCQERGIGFFSTGFDIPSLDYLASLGAERFKVPSGEITNLPYLRHIGSFSKPVILSTGMATLGEIEDALEALESAGTPRERITVLHCNTEYPTPMADVNLRAITRIRDAFGVAVGYSDHTPGIEVPIAAVARGATVIEKHLTLDRTLPGPDHKASLEPGEFTAMVRAIRNIEQALGDGIKRPSPSEMGNRPIARKSLVASGPIRTGEPFTPNNVTAKRPGTGISPMRWDEVIGRAATRDYAADEFIEP